MATLTLDASFRFEVQATSAPLDAIRAEFVRRLRADGQLIALLGGDIQKIVRRYRRATIIPSDFPIVTYFDLWHSVDDIVPLIEMTFQVDIWAEDGDKISERILATLDQKPFGVLSSGEANVTFLHCTDSRDDPVFDGDVERKMLTFRVIAYRLK